MAEFTQKQPGKRRSDDLDDPVVFDGSTGVSKARAASQEAGRSIGNIDDVLAENDAARAQEGSNIKSPDALSKDEKNANAPWTTNMDDKTDNRSAKQKFQGTASKLKSKKGILGALGIGGGLTGILISFAMLLPLKIIGLMDSVVNKMGAEVEHVVEVRAERVFARALLGNGSVVAMGGPFKTLVATVRTSRFETKLLNDKGLKITSNADGSVRLQVKEGPKLDDLGTFKDPEKIRSALDSNKLTNRMLKDIVKEEIPTWRWLKRAKFVKFLRVKYGIKRFGVSEKDDPNKNPQENADTAFESKAVAETVDTVEVAQEVVNCAMGETCPTDISSEDAKAFQDSNHKSGADASNAVSETATQTGEALQSEFDKSGLKGMNKFVAKQLGKIVGDKMGTLLVKGANDALIIDTVAWIDHLLYTGAQNHIFEKLPQYYKKVVLAKMFANWTANSDQTKAGQMPPELVGNFANQLNGNGDGGSVNGAETSQTFSYINGQPDQGQPVDSAAKINETGNSTNAGDQILGAYKAFADSTGLHVLANVWFTDVSPIIGSVLGTIWSVVETILSWVGIDINSLLSKATSFISSEFISLFGFDSVSPLDNGSKLYNDLGEGGTASFNDYCKGIGCRKLSNEQMVAQQNQIFADQQQYDNSKGLAYKLFDTSNTKSLVTQLAINLPTSNQSTQFAGTFSSGLGFISKIPAELGSLFSSAAFATSPDYSYKDIYGIQAYGATDSDLNTPVTDAAVAGQCDNSDGTPIVPHDGSSFDSCTIDNEIATSMTCGIDPTQGDCSGGQPTDNQPAGGSNTGGGPSVATAGAPSYCADGSATGSQKVVCSAYIFDPLQYSQTGPRGSANWDFIGCVKTNFASSACGSKYPSGNQRTVDCSSLVTFAIYDGMGIDMGGYNTGGLLASPHVKLIDNAQAGPGDILLSSDHTEVIVSNDTTSQTFHTFGAHEHYPDNPTQDVSAAQYQYGGDNLKAYRIVP